MAEVLQAVASCPDEPMKARFNRAVALVNRCIDLYGVGGLAFSFNGGKDSTVLLHLLRAAVARRREEQVAGERAAEDTDPDHPLGGILTFFFHNDADFAEITDFTHDTDRQYRLGMEVLHGSFRAGLEGLLAARPIKAILIGTRKGDPNAGDQETFCPSSPGWPAFMRVNPILGWSYHDVWSLLRAAALPYCGLYDRGYTSVGAVSNTEPNRALLRLDGSYGPAHLLHDARLERAGRSPGIERKPSAPGCLGEVKTASLLIIGDEILAAKVEDANSAFLCRELRAIGWSVTKVVVVGDSVRDIAREAAALSEAADVVLTAGGVGPTPDDVTMQALADAFGRRLARHPELESRIRAYFGADTMEAHLKMAEAPTGAEVSLIDHRMDGGAPSPFPLLLIRNLYVLPGIPALLQKKWEAVKEHLLHGEGPQPRFRTVLLRLRTTDETELVGAMEAVAAAVGVDVAVGSYPVSGQSDAAGVVLSLESRVPGALALAREVLGVHLPPGALLAEHLDVDVVSSPAPSPAAAQ